MSWGDLLIGASGLGIGIGRIGVGRIGMAPSAAQLDLLGFLRHDHSHWLTCCKGRLMPDLPPIDPETPENGAFPEPPSSKWLSSAFGLLVFGFGIAAGVLLSFSGTAALEGSASFVVTVFLSAIFILTLVGVVAYALRRPILRFLFGVATTQVETFANPLADVADAALIKDFNRMSAATRHLVQMTLARYAWLSTRRWIVASLTGLIAAMAALAGTALLFRQNELIAVQTDLLRVQNERVSEQNELLRQEVELAEAARNAAVADQITDIAALLGGILDKTAKRMAAEAPADKPITEDAARLVPVINPYLDIDPAVLMRITAASRAAKPYRFLEQPLRAHDPGDKFRVAMQSRRAELPVTYGRMQQAYGWGETSGVAQLIDRPASPERGQLIETLTRAGLRDYELLGFYGLDLSFAYAEDIQLFGLSMQGLMLSYANFDRAQIIGVDFATAALENTRFRRAQIGDTQFRGLPYSQLKAPRNAPDDAISPTALSGADFTEAVITNTDFSRLNGGAMDFDRATLIDTRFDGAALGATRFNGATFLGVSFAGSDLSSVDFDGVFVFDVGALDQISAGAVPGTFRADRYEIAPVDLVQALGSYSATISLSPAMIEDRTGATDAWQIRRVKPFEDQVVEKDGDAG
jgi:uncharacterized protein YjbI with pentapeptide repeats